ncbi:MAG TPA: hypothetical protein PLM14_10150 [Candidatus Hydrogenedentes bacterium]|nr:hypothetical protein [Candidatus Hydrogenedentota bacterium]HQH54336.1 hypothetical protein [Candidatus Hydrogenedentota bacterium]
MNIVLVISVLVGLTAAGFVWFGWDLLEAFSGRSVAVPKKEDPEEPEDSK